MFVDDMAAPLLGEALQSFGDRELYHAPAYLAAEAKRVGGTPCYWIDGANPDGANPNGANPDLLIPLIAREVDSNRGPCRDLISPYGYPGYLARSNNAAAIHRCLGTYHQEAAAQGFVSSLLRLNPVSSAVQLGSGRLFHAMPHGPVVYIDLASDPERIRLGYSQNHRRSLRKLDALGFHCSWQGPDFLDEFIAVYNQTMQRLEASAYYFFEPEYYHTLFAAADCRFVSVRDPEGTLAAAGLFLITDRCIQYHLGGTNGAFLKLAPSKMMFDFVAETFAGDSRCFVLGGGLGGRADELYRFKTGFSGSSLPFSTLRMIHDLEKYQSLSSARGELNRHGLEDDFFPAYRARA